MALEFFIAFYVFPPEALPLQTREHKQILPLPRRCVWMHLAATARRATHFSDAEYMGFAVAPMAPPPVTADASVLPPEAVAVHAEDVSRTHEWMAAIEAQNARFAAQEERMIAQEATIADLTAETARIKTECRPFIPDYITNPPSRLN